MDAEQGSTSIRSHIVSAMRAKREQGTVEIPVARFDGRLVLHCRTLTPRERIDTGLASGGAQDAEGLILAAMKGLSEALQKATTNIDGQEITVASTWLELSQELGPEGECGAAQNDEEAVLEVFGDEIDLVRASEALEVASGGGDQKAREAVTGESGAAT